MNILPPHSEKDEQYKAYYSVFKSAANQIAGDTSKTAFADWMRNVVAKFPYYEYTTARTMAVAALMAAEGDFTPERARILLRTVYGTVKDASQIDLLVIDVARYVRRLQKIE